MGGTIRGKLDFYSRNAGVFTGGGTFYDTAASNQSVFKAIWDHLTRISSLLNSAGNPIVTEVARYNGAAAYYTTNTGTDFWDGTNAFGRGAWSCWKWNVSNTRAFEVYMLLEHYSGSVTLPASALPTLYEGASNSGSNSCVMIATAISSAGQVPFQFTGSTMGAHAKAATVWSVSSGDLYCFPRSNSTGGSHTTNRENMSTVSYYSAGSGSISRTHIITDDDTLFVLYDPIDNLSYMSFAYSGLYTPKPGLNTAYPYVLMTCQNNPSWQANTPANNLSLGLLNGTVSTNLNGGVVSYAAAPNSVRTLSFFKGSLTDNYSRLVNIVPSVENYDEYPLHLYCLETLHNGYLGTLSFLKETGSIPAYTLNSTRTRCTYGLAGSIDRKLTIPWTSSVIPRSNFTHQTGYNF